MIRNGTLEDITVIQQLEKQMYWSTGKWLELWEREASNKFEKMWRAYIKKFPGGFLVSESKGEIVGVIILTKLNKVRTIPYIHSIDDFFSKDGKIAYVQGFMVKEVKNKEKITEELYLAAIKKSRELGCNKIIVVIYSSPLEEKILKRLSFKVEKEDQDWEIYPKMFVKCKIYSKFLD